MIIESLDYNESEFCEKFLPSMLGRVFHYTKFDSWIEIKKSEYINPNQDGRYSSGSVHSAQSLGRHLNAICFFDLRSQNKDILAKDLILYDYFKRRLSTKPSYILELSPLYYSKLTTINQVDESLLEEKMYIPKIESWHKGSVSLGCIEKVCEVKVMWD